MDELCTPLVFDNPPLHSCVSCIPTSTIPFSVRHNSKTCSISHPVSATYQVEVGKFLSRFGQRRHQYSIGAAIMMLRSPCLIGNSGKWCMMISNERHHQQQLVDYACIMARLSYNLSEAVRMQSFRFSTSSPFSRVLMRSRGVTKRSLTTTRITTLQSQGQMRTRSVLGINRSFCPPSRSSLASPTSLDDPSPRTFRDCLT